MGPIILRWYQEKAVDDIRIAFSLGRRRVLFVLSTGGGKTVIFSSIVLAAIAKGSRVVIVAHRKEIVRQISLALTKMGVQHGLIMAGKTQTDDPVQVGMVQTLVTRIKTDKIDAPDLLIVDEAHHEVAGSWRSVTDAWTKCRILGVTATPERLDGKGLGDAFDEIVLGPSMSVLIGEGHLAEYDYLAPPNAIDMSGVKTRGGDYAVDDLEKAMMASAIVGDSVEHYGRFLDGRPAIAFCVTRAHARAVAKQFCDAGWKAAAIDGSMSSAEREDLIAALADGRLNVLTSCELISEGVDVPVCAGAILLRPTKSLAMFLQQVGRILRPKPDGSRAVILDHVGNVHLHGMPDLLHEWTLDGKTRRDKDAEVTTCSLCFKVFPKGAARQIAENWALPSFV
jgi:DNA repair protein RadD